MKKFLLIILILVLLLIIYIFSFKENFSSNNFDLNDIGLDNLNNFSPIKCSVKVDTESISETKTDDYKKCFTDSDSDKYIEIDKSNNKCKIYEKVSCSGDTDGLLHTNLNTPTKILFRRKSRELLINSQEITQTTAAGTTSVTSSATQQVKRIDGYIDNLYSNSDNFKGVETYLTNNLFNYLNDSNQINLNDYFCCLAEHLYVIRLIPTQESNSSENIENKLGELRFNTLIPNLLTNLNNAKFDISKIKNYYKKLENKNSNHYLLCYNIQVLKVILLYYIVKNIKEDNYYKKYNSTYITFLFNSFKRGYKIWYEYFNKCIDKLNLSNDIKQLLKKIIIDEFFSNQNNENIYKLFIYSSALLNNNNLEIYNDNDNNQSIQLLTYNDNKINYLENIQNNLYVFYYSNEVIKKGSKYHFKNCMQYKTNDLCDNSCDFENNKCIPKKCGSSDSCSTASHCEKITVDSDPNICYDNVRIENDNFYDKNENFNDKCINKIYDSNGNIINDDDDLSKKCKDGCILSKHDDTNTCIKSNFINENTFYEGDNCKIIKDRFMCDSKQSCFWENNNCYPNSLGEDSMKCEDFKSNERCPKNKCVWYENKCKDIYDLNRNNSNTLNSNQEELGKQVVDNTNFEIKNINCLAINNNKNNIDKMNECLYNNCEWQNERNLCVDKINKGCLTKDSNKCVDKFNFNNIINRNMCKFIVDQNNENGSQVCVDNELKIPCKYYKINDCPTTENPKVNLQGEIIEEPYCIISTDRKKCLEKNNINNSCVYNYLKDGDKIDNYTQNCKELEFNIVNDNTTKKVNISINKENLPCSLLENSNCSYNKNSDMCTIRDGVCKTNKDKEILFSRIDDVINDMSFSNYDEITDRIGNIYSKQRHNRLCRLDEQIHGNIVSINNNSFVTDSNIDNISYINNFIIFFINLNIDDLKKILNINDEEFQSKKIEYENFLENLNIIIKSKIELNPKLNLDNKHIWISNKYKITNIDTNDKKIIISDKLYYNIDKSPITTNYGNIIIDDVTDVTSTTLESNTTITIPYHIFIKWFIPNPMSNLEDCLNELKFKNLDRERYFNI